MATGSTDRREQWIEQVRSVGTDFDVQVAKALAGWGSAEADQEVCIGSNTIGRQVKAHGHRVSGSLRRLVGYGLLIDVRASDAASNRATTWSQVFPKEIEQ